ncbi:hypothetical protein ACFQ7J_05885 [Streptomyces sp. NPDC056501]|uniref:hypothetical protein n=1 Tax=Streptomyces sp. NPDC056501 TaxID=3345841 RepID=UPI003682D6CC
MTWIPGMDSPDRMDAAVHALTELADPATASTGTPARTTTTASQAADNPLPHTPEAGSCTTLA